MINEETRISIIGGSGTGKTTLANNLGRILGIPVIHIDGINYLENWILRDSEERDKIIKDKIKEQQWIIDGTYTTTLKERLERSNLVIYLDYSTFAQIRGVLKRFLKHHGEEKQEIAGCKENLTWYFFSWVIVWRRKKRHEIVTLINSMNNKQVLIFKNRRALNKWYLKEFQENMEID